VKHPSPIDHTVDLVLPLMGDAAVPRLSAEPAVEVTDPATGITQTLTVADGDPTGARCTIESLVYALGQLDGYYQDRELIADHGEAS